MIVSLVRFTSRLSDDAVQATFEERADQYRNVPGLVEKLYLRFREGGEFGAVYVWDSEKALMDFRKPSSPGRSRTPTRSRRHPRRTRGRLPGDPAGDSPRFSVDR